LVTEEKKEVYKEGSGITTEREEEICGKKKKTKRL